MKRFSTLFALLLLVGACEKDPVSAPWLRLSGPHPGLTLSELGHNARLILSPAGDETALVLESNVLPELKLEGGTEWCRATLTGATLTIQADPLGEPDDRTCSFRLNHAGTALGAIDVVQSGRATLSLAIATVQMPLGGGKQEVGIETNQSVWKAESSKSWLTVGQQGNRIILQAAPNTTGVPQTATVTVTAGEGDNTATASFDVHQNDDAFILEITLPTDGATFRVPIEDQCSVVIDWGDGSEPETAEGKFMPVNNPAPRHTYERAGDYTIRITGEVEQLGAMSIALTDNERAAITAVRQWGDLKAKSLENAFYFCKNLRSIPSNVDDSFDEVENFHNAFVHCETLEDIPEGLFANCIAATNFKDTFGHCLALKKVPEKLFAECPAATSMGGVFSFCSGLAEVPQNLFAGCTSITDLSSVFQSCTSLKTVPADLFADCTKTEKVTYLFFNSGLETLPAGLFDPFTKVKEFVSVLSGTAIAEVPEDLLLYCTSATRFTFFLASCANLKEVPAGLFRTCVKATDFKSTLRGTAIKEVPVELFDACPDVTTFEYLFWECPELIGVPEGLFAKQPKVDNFHGLFRDCPKLASIPAHLFDACTVATNFNQVAVNCIALKEIPAALFDQNRKVTNFGAAFQGCINLEGESPYSIVDGAKVHLYERSAHTDLFKKPSSYRKAFSLCVGLSDIEAIGAAGWE